MFADLSKAPFSPINGRAITLPTRNSSCIVSSLAISQILYCSSADSVLQIAAHEDIIPIEEEYKICEIARELTMQDEFLVGRVIARPFIGENGAFERTANRHDYALKPFDKTVMNTLKDNDYDVVSLGKIVDIFDGEG